MITAIPIWMGRVSPVFDVAGRVVLLFEPSPRGVTRQELQLTECDQAGRVRQLVQTGVGRLICGGISVELAARIREAGIEVISDIQGPIDSVLQATGQAAHEPSFRTQ